MRDEKDKRKNDEDDEEVALTGGVRGSMNVGRESVRLFECR